MVFEIRGIRPALISEKSFEGLDELRGFRHVFRHAYTYGLDDERVVFLLKRILKQKQSILDELDCFRQIVKIVKINIVHFQVKIQLMKKSFPISFESVYQVFSLIVSIIIVHAVYVSVIRPRAEIDMEKQHAALKADKAAVMERSVYIILKDYEQESCFVLMFWALAIISYKAVSTIRQRALLNLELIPIAEGMRILPEDTRALSRHIEALPESKQQALLSRALLAALHRFSSTRNIQDASNATHSYCEAEADRLESELAMLRYIAWAIPSLGFIGTVRGIGDALAQAYKAVEGDIFGVTTSLGVAFNSTLIALLISLLLMFLVHQLQLIQERYVQDTETYCEENLTRHLYVP